MIDYASIGQKVKQIRLRKGVTQEQIADGEWDAALQTLSKSDANNAYVQVAKGYAYAGKGDVDKARAEWEKAAAQGSADAKHNLAELAKSLE